MGLRLSGPLLLLPLAAAPERAIGVVAHRHVEEHGDDAEHDPRGHVLLDDRDEDREDHRREGRPVDRAAPGRLLVELVLTGLCAGDGLRRRAAGARPPGAPRRLDGAGLGAAVLTPALLPRLSHGPLRSLTRPRSSGTPCPRVPPWAR